MHPGQQTLNPLNDGMGVFSARPRLHKAPYVFVNPKLKRAVPPACGVTKWPVQIKALNKKIRQVEELEAKVAAGGVVPSEEQRQKLARKPALVAELAEVRGMTWKNTTEQAVFDGAV